MTEEEKPKLEIDWVKTFAGALAAVSSAVLLSTLGAAGTLIGAALGSVILTISSAFYSQGLARSKAKLAAAQELAQQKVALARTDVRRAGRKATRPEVESNLEHAEEQLDEASTELEGATEETGDLTWKERLAVLPWKRIVMAAVGLFLIAMLVITAFELLTGRAVSSFTGGTDSRHGTSISRLTGGGGDDKDGKQPKKEKDKERDQPSGTTPPAEGSDPSGSTDREPSTSEEPATPESSAPTEEPSEGSATVPNEEPSPSTSGLQESPGAAEQAPVE